MANKKFILVLNALEWNMLEALKDAYKLDSKAEAMRTALQVTYVEYMCKRKKKK